LSQRAIAGIEQYELLAGIDQGRDEWMLIVVGIDVIGEAKVARFVGAALRPETGVETLANRFAVEDVCDFEISERESINGGLHCTLHCRGHAVFSYR